jgi:hypothetical protein
MARCLSVSESCFQSRTLLPSSTGSAEPWMIVVAAFVRTRVPTWPSLKYTVAAVTAALTLSTVAR